MAGNQHICQINHSFTDNNLKYNDWRFVDFYTFLALILA